MQSKESLQENQYHFPYHHLAHEHEGALYIFRHLFWGLEHYTYIQYVIDEITKVKMKSLADVGCGEGRILTELSSKLENVELAGYDVSETALQFARGFTQTPSFNTNDITASPLPAQYDAIVSCEVIEHITPDQIDNYCKNIAASLTTGGSLFLTTPTTNIPVNPKHYQHFTYELLDQHLSPYFVIEEVKYLNVVNKSSRLLNRLIANRFYLSNIPSLNRLVFTKYKKTYLFGNEKTGSRIYIKAKKK